MIVAVWWFGGVSLSAKLWVGGLLGLAGCIAWLPGLQLGRADAPLFTDRWTQWQVACVCLWLAWAVVQSIALPRGIWGLLAPGVAETAIEYAGSDASSTLSLVPELTRQTLAWHFMLAAAFAISALIFNTRRSRTTLLFVLTINVVMLCCWGIVQRSTGTTDLLPGVANYVLGSNPFASFIYKNSGGAAVVLGVAALSGLLAERVLQVLERRRPTPQTTSSHNGYYPRSYISSRRGRIAKLLSRESLENCLSLATDPQLVLLGFGLALCLTGLANSLSRGAWIGLFCGTVIFIASFVWRHRSQSVSLVFVGLTLLMAMGLVVFFNNQQQVMVRVDMLDQEVIRRDDRWHHWQAASKAALAYLPVGAGLGTYGYSSLPFQHNTYDGWYKQAHNQYLETLVESGLVGLLLVGLFLTATTVRVFQLMSSPRSSEAFLWGGVLCVAVTGMAVQSSVDFVITTPANGLTLAVLLGAAVNVPYRRQSSSSCPKPPAADKAQWKRAWNLLQSRLRPELRPWMGAALMAAGWLYAFPILWNAHRAELVLDRTGLPPTTMVPTIESCDENISLLESQSDSVAGTAELHERLAAWYTLRFRSELLQSYCAQAGQPPSPELWQATNLTQLFGILQGHPIEERPAARAALLATPGLAATAASIYSELSRSVIANPLVARTQLALAEQAPLAAIDYEPFLQRARHLSGTSSELLYACGLLASLAGDVQSMNLAWSQALHMNSRRIAEITSLSLRWQDSIQIVNQLYPQSPAILIAAYRRPDLPLTQQAREQSLARAQELLQSSAAKLDMSERERLQWLAKGAELKQNWPLAVTYYQRLVTLDPQSAAIRFQFAQVLLNVGDRRGAWTQVHTGAAIDPGNARANQLLRQIDQVSRPVGTR